MSKYTTEVRYICEHYAGLNESEGYISVDDVIERSRRSIFDFNYPIFDDDYRPVLENKILKHYYGREIGAETVGRWKLWLNSRMNEIMPYYNKLYSLFAKEFNPLYDTDYYRKIDRIDDRIGNEENKQGGTINDTIERTDRDLKGGTIIDTKEGTVSTTESGTITDERDIASRDGGTERNYNASTPKNERWDTFQDTPQGSLVNVANETYLTNARHIVDDGTGSTSDTTITFGKTVTTDDDNERTLNTLKTEELDTTDTRTLDTEDNFTSNTGMTKTIDTGNTRDSVIKDTEDYLEHVYGKMNSGLSYAKAINEYRKNLFNIDMLIIKDLADLFMLLW